MTPSLARTWAVVAVTTLMLVASGCSSEEPEGDPQVDVLVAEETTDVTETTDSTAGTDAQEPEQEEPAGHDVPTEQLEGALVSSFPADVPLYDGQIVDSLSGISDFSGAPEWNVTMTTQDSVDTVGASVREAYSTNGWSMGSEMESAGGNLFTARGAGYTVSVTYGDAFGPETTINYGVSADG